MVHVYKTSFRQDPNVGLSAYANDSFCLLPKAASVLQARKIQKVLNVKTHRLNMCGTSLVGAFISGNNNAILVPSITFDDELKKLEKWKVPFHILETDYTALGNNIVATDDACLISPDLAPFKDEIKDVLAVQKIKTYKIDGIPTVGALMTVTKKGCLLSAFASEKDAEFIANFFNVPVARGTVNLGSPYVKSGLVANNFGFLYGERTGGPEAVAIDEALGFLNP